MMDRPRAALAALTLACTLALPAAAPRAAAQARTPAAAAGQPRTLPPVRALPPASRRPAAARPAPPPAATPVANRPAVRPAANPAPMPAASNAALAPNGEKWNDITPESVNDGRMAFPVGRGHVGPSVLRVQVLLDRAYFSPAMIDGRWGKNTQNAVYWLQAREGLPATGVVDSATYARLERLAGSPAGLVRRHALTADDVRGPFVAIPANIYEHARLSCSCYESLSEKLTELFHIRLDLLQKLNPGVNLDAVKAGDTLSVLAVRDPEAPPAGEVRALVVSGTDNYVQALDASGRILYHFAATLGSSFDPSPQGDFRVLSVHPNPWWRYQPKILAHVPDWKPEAMIPPGPNNSVGRVWMTLSAPHYGIHGTKSPETIGYAQSAGCVRLTNWDVMFLSKRLTPGVSVAFRGTRPQQQPAQPARAAAAPAAADTPRVLGVRADSTRRDSAAAAAPRDTGAARAPAPQPRDTSARTPQPAPARDTTPAAAPKPAAPAPATPAPRPAPAKPDSAAPSR